MTTRPVEEIAGAWVFVPEPHHDERGFFSRTMNATWLRDAGIDSSGFIQDSVSRSRRGVVRGMHLRSGRGEAKLVRCSFGSVFDAVVDLRRDSPTYRNVLTLELTDDPPTTLYVPAGCAHGFQALSDPADVSYRIDREHDPAEDVAIAWDDDELGIAWPLPVTVVCVCDKTAIRLAAVTGMS
jgi:dTDP-4-dehydrorhamnose 3,5-epimerase